MNHRDYYGVLGVPRDADGPRIKGAYRRLARRHHPDLNPGDHRAAERFKAIGEAYEVLSDPERRRQYDQLIAPGARFGMPPRPGNTNARPDFSGLSDLFEQFFGNGVPFRETAGGTGRPGPGPWPTGGPPPAPELRASLEIGLEEALHGTLRTVSDGAGGSFRVRIPPGVRDGAHLRARAPDGRRAVFEVRIAEHPRFRRNGDRLETVVSVGFAEAALGGEIRVPTLDGRARIRVPAGISSGTALRIPGRGMPRERGGRGDLIARIRIEAPKELSLEEKAFFRRFSKSRESPED